MKPINPVLLVLVGFSASACSDAMAPRPNDPGEEIPQVEHELLVERVTHSGQRSFYTMALDGTNVRLFEGVPEDALILAPSPDGRRIAYLKQIETGDRHIWIMDRDGSNRRAVLEGTHSVEHVAWAPDGLRLVFTDYTYFTTADIAIVAAEGDGYVNLTPDAGDAVIFDRQPAWSPDGARIAFVSNRTGTSRLWTMSPTGEDPVQLRTDDATESSPTWSPDGEWLAFRRGSPDGVGIAIARKDGTDLRFFPVTGPFQNLVWAPNGRLIYTSAVTGDYEVYSLDLESGLTDNLTHHADHDVRAVPIRLVTPDG